MEQIMKVQKGIKWNILLPLTFPNHHYPVARGKYCYQVFMYFSIHVLGQTMLVFLQIHSFLGVGVG